MRHVHRLTETRHDLDPDDKRIQAVFARGLSFFAKRQNCRHQHGADMCVGNLQHVIIIQRMGRRAIG